MKYSGGKIARVFILLHMHTALGRKEAAHVGCTRPGVEVWKLGEAILLEITESTARRLLDLVTGFEMLEP